MTGSKNYDVIIVGGSYAGLSAAMSLGRSLRKVLVIDSGLPCNASTPHSHNFLTRDGSKPAEISRLAKDQVALYKTVHFLNDLAVKGTQTATGFDIVLRSGETVSGDKLIFATGIKDQLPDIKGLRACWGISVIHCPYCHGYEYHGKKTAILGNGDAAVHYALLVSNLTKDLTIFTNGSAQFTAEQLVKFQRHNIQIVESNVVEIEHDGGYMQGVVLEDNTRVPFHAMYFKPPFVQHSDIPVLLGCGLNEQGYITVDAMQKTTLEGVYACGDNVSPMRSVANAVAAGSFTGAVVNRELANERF